MISIISRFSTESIHTNSFLRTQGARFTLDIDRSIKDVARRPVIANKIMKLVFFLLKEITKVIQRLRNVIISEAYRTFYVFVGSIVTNMG